MTQRPISREVQYQEHGERLPLGSRGMKVSDRAFLSVHPNPEACGVETFGGTPGDGITNEYIDGDHAGFDPNRLRQQ